MLVDTGATISFISKSLVPQLKPKPEVLRSELSIMMGTGETRDTDHYSPFRELTDLGCSTGRYFYGGTSAGSAGHFVCRNKFKFRYDLIRLRTIVANCSNIVESSKLNL